MPGTKFLNLNLRWSVAASVLLLFLTAVQVVPQGSEGRIDVRVTRPNSQEGIEGVQLILEGPYPVIAATSISTLYTPNAALSPEMRAQIDALISSAPPTLTAEVIANAAMRMEAQFLGLPAPAALGTSASMRGPALALFPLSPEEPVTTDSSGRHSFTDLIPGHYRMRAQRDGYFVLEPSGVIGALSSATTTVTVAAGRSTPEIPVTMVRGALVRGRIQAPNGQLLSGVQVLAYRVSYQYGRKVLQVPDSTVTDDRGEYRFTWMPPGEYYFAAVPRRRNGTSGPENYTRTFYPGNTDADASIRVSVTEGADISGIDIRVRSGDSGTISGKIVTSIVGPDGQLESPTTFYLLPRDKAAFIDAGGGMSFPNMATDPSGGQFEIRGVVPGSYDLVTVIPDGKYGRAMGRTQIEVGSGSVENVTLDVRPALQVRVRLTIDGAPPPFTMAVEGRWGNTISSNRETSVAPAAFTGPLPAAKYQVFLRSMEPSPSPFDITAQQNIAFDPSGVFTFSNVLDGQYSFGMSSLPPNGYISDIRMAGRSVFDDGVAVGSISGDIEVTVKTGGAIVQGVVRDTSHNPVAAAKVVLVPPSSRRQNTALYKVARSDANGNFTITGVGPGEYKLFAWDSTPGTAYMNADFIAPFESRGRTIGVSESETVRTDVDFIPTNPALP